MNLYLDLSDNRAMADFLYHWIGFASEKARHRADAMLERYDRKEEIEPDQMAAVVKDLAEKIWPIRFAVNRFFNEEGALVEWDRVELAVRRSTAHLMQRFREAGEAHSINGLFADDDFGTAFSEEDRAEIEQVRHHIREDYAKNHVETLETLIEEGEAMLKHFKARIAELREIAEGLEDVFQKELYEKITHMEDRCLFGGEHISDERLKEEIAYYKDQKELPIEA